jgi:hypothetical protein
MKRRQFFGVAAGVAVSGGLAAAGLAGAVLAGGSEPDAVEAVLFKRLSYLKLDRRGVRQFARDYTARNLMSARKLRALSASGWIYQRAPSSWLGCLMPSFPFGEERIVTLFLLSSDFFPVCDEGRTVRYLAFFDPQLQANPFARLRGETSVRSFNHANPLSQS